MENEKQKTSRSKIILVALIVAAVLFACSKSADTTMKSNNSSGSVDCSGVAKSFSTDVSPIIQTTCATGSSCHSAGSINGPGELRTYSEISNARADIRSAILSGLMPKTGSLTSSQKNSIICWIDNGALNN